MEISDVRKKLLETIDRARRATSDRRARVDAAERDYAIFLNRVATPLFRQVANVLRAEHHPFSVSTPGGSVRLMSDRSSQDYIELGLDTSGAVPQVLGRTSRGRGRRIVESERPVREDVPVGDLTEADVLAFLCQELEPFVEK
jgi:hypothetical protein